MKFTKEPPYSFGELACIINATIDVLNLSVTKLSTASSGQINNALIKINNGYRSSFSIGDQWLQFVDIFEKLSIDASTREKILKLADNKLEHLKSKRELI
jgi:hypothetical protein